MSASTALIKEEDPPRARVPLDWGVSDESAKRAYGIFAYRTGASPPWEHLSFEQMEAWREVVEFIEKDLVESGGFECIQCGEDLECSNAKCDLFVQPEGTRLDTRDLLAPAEVRDILMVQMSTLAHWRRKGCGPPWLKVGKQVRYPELGLDRWIESQRADPKPKATAVKPETH